MKSSVNGQDRVEHKLSQALKYIHTLDTLSSLKSSASISKRIELNKNRLQKKKKELVFLSLRARDKVTRFYASNALKEIAKSK